jgi:hypothetical protein
VAADDLQAFVDRPDWTVDEKGATYAPSTTGWRAIVWVPIASGTLYARYHVAVIDPDGTARYVQTASSISEAPRVAEGQVPRQAVTVHLRQRNDAACMRDAGGRPVQRQ